MVPGEYLVGPRNDGVDDVVELGYVAGGVEVAEPVEGFKGAVVVLGEVEAVEFLEGLPAGFEAGVSLEEFVETGLLCGGEGVASAQQREPGSEHFWVVGGFDAVGLSALDIAAHRTEPSLEPSDGCGTGPAHDASAANTRR